MSGQVTESDSRPVSPTTDSPVAAGSSYARDEVAARAYLIYCGHGNGHGHDVDDWLEAERQLCQGNAERLADPEQSPGL